MAECSTRVRLVDGQAEVRMDARTFTVSRRDLPNDPYSCPVELLVGALGS